MNFEPIWQRKVFWLWAVLFTSLAIGAVFTARPAFRMVKRYRAMHLIEDAKEHESIKELQTALEKSYAAYKLAPLEPTVARYMAQIVQKISPSNAIDFWIPLVDQTQEVQDLTDLINLAFQLNKLNVANKYLPILKEKDPESGQTLLLQSKWHALRGEFDLAAEEALKAARTENPPPDANGFYIQFSQMASQGVIQAEGIQYLKNLALKNDQEGLNALRTLATYSYNNDSEVENLIERLNHHPLAQSKDYLLALSLGQKINKVDANTVFKQAEILFKDASMEDKINLGRWLNSQGAHEKTLHCITMQEAFLRSDLFLIWGDAMAITGQWDALQKALEDPKLPLDETLRHLFLARVAEAQKNPLKADHQWNKAFAEAGKNPEKLNFLVEYAVKLKEYNYAAKGLQILTTIPTIERDAWQKWIELGLIAKDTNSLIKTLQKMSANYPMDPAIENDLRYMQILKGPIIDKSFARAEQFVIDNPMMLAYRITLALGLVRQNDPQKALDLLKDFPVNWIKIQPRWLAIYLGVLRANQKDTMASLMELNFNESTLLPEELHFAQTGKLS